MQMFMTMPPHMPDIIKAMIEKNWFVTIYDAGIDDIYEPSHYLYNKEVHGCTYKLVLDRNIFSYIIGSTNPNRYSENTQKAIGLILFCQFCEILIEPSLAIHEYINFMESNIDKALDEIETFRMIDNYADDPILLYFQGHIKVLPPGLTKKLNRKALKKSFIKKNWLRNWNEFYVTNLKLIEVYYSAEPVEEKLKKFVEWMSDNFQISFPAFLFAAYLFSDSRLKNMVKYKPHTSKEERISAVKNMTWDIYFIQQAREQWQTNEELDEIIFATNDKVIQKVLRSLLIVGKSGDLSSLKSDFSKKNLDTITTLYEYIKGNKKRKYKTKEWTPEYIKQVTIELEQELLL